MSMVSLGLNEGGLPEYASIYMAEAPVFWLWTAASSAMSVFGQYRRSPHCACPEFGQSSAWMDPTSWAGLYQAFACAPHPTLGL